MKKSNQYSDASDERKHRVSQAFLEGEKLYLRNVEEEDLYGPYFNWLNDPEVTKYLETGVFPNTIEKMKEYLESLKRSSNDIFLAIIDKKTNKHIGNIRLGPINWIHRKAYIGILIGEKAFQGKGYGTEAIKLLVEHAFNRLNLNKISAGVVVENKASIKAFEKAGFKVECTLKKEFYVDGKYHDAVIMSIFKEDCEKAIRKR